MPHLLSSHLRKKKGAFWAHFPPSDGWIVNVTAQKIKNKSFNVRAKFECVPMCRFRERKGCGLGVAHLQPLHLSHNLDGFIKASSIMIEFGF